MSHGGNRARVAFGLFVGAAEVGHGLRHERNSASPRVRDSVREGQVASARQLDLRTEGSTIRAANRGHSSIRRIDLDERIRSGTRNPAPVPSPQRAAPDPSPALRLTDGRAPEWSAQRQWAAEQQSTRSRPTSATVARAGSAAALSANARSATIVGQYPRTLPALHHASSPLHGSRQSKSAGSETVAGATSSRAFHLPFMPIPDRIVERTAREGRRPPLGGTCSATDWWWL